MFWVGFGMLEGMHSSTNAARRPRKVPSTQMLIAAVVTEVVAVLSLVLAFTVNVGSPSTVLATFLGLMIVSVLAATLAFILALTGLIRYSRYGSWFLSVLVVSVLANPVLWLFLIGTFF